ncbi:MAG: DotU family type IV/VI secretion system protein [Desulfovibrio sp.]|jgi:type VI secretion system protein ImpK|nr:DotU family type IV/VI secretion system protein [Desulfovibrio sp.]
MRWADYFNEAIATAMLAAKAGSREGRLAQDTPPAHMPPLAPERPAAPEGAAADKRTPAREEDLTKAPLLLERLVRLLDQAVRRAVAEGLDREYATTADLAVSAFIDEILLSSAWAGREEWMGKSLQLVRHDTATAGEDFYRILDVLLEKAQKAAPHGSGIQIRAGRGEENPEREMLKTVLEIFALCLAQGFSGMFFDDSAAIRAKLDAIGHFVPEVRRGMAARDADLLFPAAYPASPAAKPLFGSLRCFDGLDWLLWLTPILVVGFLYYFYDMHLNALLDALTQGSRMP